MTKGKTLGRRAFFSLSATIVTAAAGVAALPGRALAAPAITGKAAASATRSLNLFNVNTGEGGKFLYWEQGSYIPEVMRQVDHILRDRRTDEVHAIAPDLLDLVSALARKLDSSAPFHIVSAYRSHDTNEEMAATKRGVAKRSYHMDGKALDLRMPNRGLHMVRGAAMQLKGGGVGYYRRSNFVHVDVGPVRHW